MIRTQGSFEEYIGIVSKSFRNHLNLSIGDLLGFIFVLFVIFIVVYVAIKLWKKSKVNRYYEDLFNQLCIVYGLSIEEKIKLNTLAELLRISHPLLLMVQPKRWSQFLSDPEISYLYKKLF